MAFTEFYSVSGGDNTAAGSTTGAAVYTATNGGWDATTGVFTPASGNPSATVSVGMFASVYIDGATVAVFVGRVTAVDATTVTVSLTVKSGTAPTTNANARTIKVGGAWAQPAAADPFPVTFFKKELVNAAGEMPRLSASGTWTVSAALAMTAGALRIEGMTAAAGDGGMLIIDGGGSSINLLNPAASGNQIVNVTMRNTLSNASVPVSNALYRRCRFTNIGLSGINGTATSRFEECEFDNCNTTNTAAHAGYVGRAATFIRCKFHDNVGSNNAGASINTSQAVFMGCVFYGNVLGLSSSISQNLQNCDFYNNTTGISMVGIQINLENCNFAKHSGTAVAVPSGTVVICLNKCGFGSGADANGTDVQAASATVFVENLNPITYTSPTSPWRDPANGDFTIVASQAKNAGRGTFLKNGAIDTVMVGYPDRGAAQHQEPGRVF